jgi:hypothetical protein
MENTFSLSLDMPLRSPAVRWVFRALLVGMVAGVAMAATATGQVIDANTAVSLNLGTIFAVGGMAIPLVWALSKAITRMTDRMDLVEKRANTNLSHIVEMKSMMRHIELTMCGLPCQTNAKPPEDCQGKKD